MDQNRIANKKYHLLDRHLLIKRALQMILPVSLASFIISYTCTRFSVISSYHFMTTLVLPFFTHVFERKYMFLVCNAILAFLMKTLNLNNNNNNNNNNSPSASYSLSDLDGHVDSDDSSLSTIILAIHPQSLSENFEDAADRDEHEEQEQEERGTVHQEEEDEAEDDHEEQEQEERCTTPREEEDEVEEEEEESFFSENVLGDFVIESEGFDMDYEEEEYVGGEGLMGEDHDEKEQMEVMVNMNTEDLNRKFEEFIRKMKEELRIQEQQQWIVAV